MTEEQLPRSPHTCPVCHGTGRIDNGPYFLMRADDCLACEGWGRVLCNSKMWYLEKYRAWLNTKPKTELSFIKALFSDRPLTGEEDLLYTGSVATKGYPTYGMTLMKRFH